MVRGYLLLAVMLFSVCAQAQGAAAPAPEAMASSPPAAPVLEDLMRQAAAYRKIVPNFSCEEDAISSAIRGGKLKLRIEFTGTLRVVRDAEGELKEQFTYSSYMGKPTVEGGKYRLPLYVSGFLSGANPGFFDASPRSCFRYKQSDGRIEFDTQPGSSCEKNVGVTGAFTLDENGSLLHLEVRRPPKEAARSKFATVGSIDYGVLRLNNQDYRLPVHVYAENEHGYSFEATYVGCHLFKATSTILPDVTPVSESGVAQPHP